MCIRDSRELKALAADYPFVKAISLAKNSGQHNAVMAGLNYAQGDLLIAMDDDMQTHPSQLHFLLDEIEKGYDIVYGYYPDKKQDVYKRQYIGREKVHQPFCTVK